ncbi:MAG: hypothetical protein AAGF94_16510 [Pseudomonadota bacterium]
MSFPCELVAGYESKQGDVLIYGSTYQNGALGQSIRGGHRYCWLD